MSKHFNLLQSMIDKLSTRERVMVMLGILAVIYMIWDTFMIVPLQSSNKTLLNQRVTIQGQVADLQSRLIIANGLLKNTARKKLISDISLVEKKIISFDEKILERLEGRVAPEYMIAMLRDVLNKNQRLELLSISNLPAEPLTSKEQQQTDSTGKQLTSKQLTSKQLNSKPVDPDLAGVFMHSLELELEGRYLNILEYLQALEVLPWKIFWDHVKLEVLEYPKVRVHIKVHTFSLKDGWLSV